MSAPLQPVSSKLPWNIKQKIIDWSTDEMKPTIRQLNEEFKHLVDNSFINHYRLRVELIKNSSKDAVFISLKTDRPNTYEEDDDSIGSEDEENGVPIGSEDEEDDDSIGSEDEEDDDSIGSEDEEDDGSIGSDEEEDDDSIGSNNEENGVPSGIDNEEDDDSKESDYQEENDFRVEFHHDPEGYRVVKANSEEKVVRMPGKHEEFPFITRAVLHLAKIFKNPKLKLDRLQIKFHSPPDSNCEPGIDSELELRKDALLRKWTETIGKLNHHLQVELLAIDIDGSQDDVLTVLQCLKAKNLKKFWLGGVGGPPIHLEIDRIAQLDQWKETKDLRSFRYIVSKPSNDFSHFDKVFFEFDHMTLEEFKEILEKYASRPSFRMALIQCSNFDSEAFCTYLSQFPIGQFGSPPYEFEYPLPDSPGFLYVMFNSSYSNIRIQKWRFVSPK